MRGTGWIEEIKKPLSSLRRQRLAGKSFFESAAAAGRSAGRLHAGQDEPLPFLEIDVGVRQHHVRPLFQKHPQPVHLERGIPAQGFFGYVHSQGRASAAGHREDPDAVTGRSLFFHCFFELLYRTVSKTYHTFLLAEIENRSA
jgi:hypothetical protein